MATNLKIAYPHVPFEALSITSSETYSTSYPLENLVNGSRGKRAELATAMIGQHEIEFDLGSGVTQACDYLALGDAKVLKKSGVTQLQLKGSSASYRSPASISGLVAWIDPTKDVTYDTGTMLISQISDQSGLGNHATQGTDANKPTLSTVSAGINGNRCMTFDGTNDYFRIDGVATALSGNDTPYTVFAVIQQAATADSDTILNFASASGVSINQIRANSGSNYAVYRKGDTLGAIQVFGGTPSTSLKILTFKFTGTTMTMYQNGTATGAAQAQDTTTLTATRGAIGAYYDSSPIEFFNGKMGDLIVFNTALSDTDRQTVEAFLTSKWSTTAACTIDLSTLAAYTGGQSKDYIATFTETSACRYWIVQMESDLSTLRPLSKLYFGKLFDIGRDPQFSREVSSEKTDKQIYEKKRFTLEYDGISTTKRQEFETKIGQFSDSNDIFLYTNSYNAVMLGTSLTSCAIKDYSFEAKGAKQNSLKIELEETY